MNFFRLRAAQRWFALLGSIVMMLAVLAPTVSRALAAEHAGNWIELCTTSGSRWVQIDWSESEATLTESPPPDGVPSVDHCPLCVLVADKLTPPAHIAIRGPSPLLAQTAPLAPDVIALPLRELSWTSPRGPPAPVFALLLA